MTMSTEDEQTQAPAENESTTSETETDDEDWKGKFEAQRRMNRELEKRAKENAEAAKKLAEIEDSKKSEIEKLTEQQQVAQKRAEEAELKALRLEVAASKGLTPAQAKRLVGGTIEELEADADELIATFAASDDGTETDTHRRPRGPLKSGASGKTEPQPSATELVDRMMKRHAIG